MKPIRSLGIWGNITLLESVCLFLPAPVSLYNTASKRDSNEGEESNEEKEENKGEDYTVAHVPNGRGGWFVALIGRRKIVPNEGNVSNVGRAFTFILCGAILFIEIVSLALFTGY